MAEKLTPHPKFQKRSRKELEKMPLPSSDLELRACTLWYFGVPLKLRNLSGYSYEVHEDYDSYHGHEFAYSTGSTEGYDYSGKFWETIFGRLTCGGISRASYGQFESKGYRRQKRLDKWIRARGKKEACNFRKPFERLVLKHYGEEEISLILGSRS